MGDFLLVTIQVDMHDQLASALQDDLTNKIGEVQRKRRADRHLLFGYRRLVYRADVANTLAMARVSDAQTVVVGMQPAVAITLVGTRA